MDRHLFVLSLFGLSVLALAYFLTPVMAGREMSIPPTNAFSRVATDNGTLTALTWDDTLYAPQPPYAQLSSLQTQACAAAGAASNVTLNTNDSIHKITHSTTTRTHEIRMQQTGTYSIVAAPQVGEVTTQADGLHNFWMMKNGAQVANTNVKTHITVQVGGDETVMEIFNWTGRLQANDVIYFQQSCTDADIGIIFTAAAVPPATPSVIVSIAKLNW